MAAYLFQCIQQLLTHFSRFFLVHPKDKNGVNFPDDESVAVSIRMPCSIPHYIVSISTADTHQSTNWLHPPAVLCRISSQSTDTLRPEQDISPKDGDGSPESRSTDRNADTTADTTASDASTRPVLNRQGKHA